MEINLDGQHWLSEGRPWRSSNKPGIHWYEHFDAPAIEKALVWDEGEHPRDEGGKFTDSGGGVSAAKNVAASYVKEHLGHDYEPLVKQPLDTEESARVADAFDKMKSDPKDPDTVASYKALTDETAAQWKAMIGSGLKVEAIPTGQANPYKDSNDLIADVKDNNHIWYYPTTSGFGSGGANASGHPLLADSGIKDSNGRPMLHNDVFRVVHDYFGHVKDGNSFRPAGEENAWRSHSAMFSPLAARAMTAETRGQTSWVYYGPYGEQNRNAKDESGVHFADQKVGLLPPEMSVRKAEWDESQHPRDESGEFSASATRAAQFISARNKNPRSDFFSHLEPDDLKNHKLIMNETRTAGAAVAPDGDIQNVFRNPDAPKGEGSAMLQEAVRRGGRTLDAYEYETPGKPGLVDYYKQNGFVETGRMKFNPAYRPQWPAERQPDVVFMAHRGGDQSDSPKSIRYYASHEWGQAKADSLAEASRPKTPQESLAEAAQRHGERKRQIGSILDTKPEGHMIKGPRKTWTKTTVAGDHFWTDGKKYITSTQMPETVGTKALEPHVPSKILWGTEKAAKTYGYDEESQKIAENKKEWENITHRFKAAKWTSPNGHPRCVRCGDEEPEDGLCMPDVRKYESMLDVWTQKFAQEFSSIVNGTIESGELSMPKKNWIEEFHSKCIAKSEACTVAWPVCPVVKADVKKYITSSNGKFIVHAESGKVLGTHDTRADAEAQLRAIEANKAVEWPMTPSMPGYGKLPIDGEKAPNQKTMKALQDAWQEFSKAVGLVFKSEEVMAEQIESDVFRIEAAGKRAYFVIDGESATRIEYQRKNAPLVPVTKADKQRYTLGAVYAPGEVDFHGDTMTEPELEKAAWAFAQKEGLSGRVGLMHQSGTDKAGKVVESYIYRGPKWTFKDTGGTEQTITPGTWMLGVVWEPEGWAKIERGAVKGYSLQGVARKWSEGKEIS